MTLLTPDQIIATPAGDLANLSAETLLQLRSHASQLSLLADTVTERLDSALQLKYTTRAHALRLAVGKDTGVVHFDDGEVRITADLPKRIEWDQKKLADIVRRIVTSGEDPAQYVDTTYRVSETKFNAWPGSLKGAFAAARTLKTGKPSFRLSLTNAQGDQ